MTTDHANSYSLHRSNLSNDQVDHKDSPGSLSITSVAVTMSTVHDDEWYLPDETVQTSESTSNDGRSEASSFRTPSIGTNQSKLMVNKFKKFTGAERTMYSNWSNLPLLYKLLSPFHIFITWFSSIILFDFRSIMYLNLFTTYTKCIP
jgi:hypothetical protein